MVTFGDSITAGLQVSDPLDRWPFIVAKEKKYMLINSGIGGTRLQNTVQYTYPVVGGAAVNNGRDTYISRIVDKNPKYVIIMYGYNDMRLFVNGDYSYTAALYENDLVEIVDGLISAGILAQNIILSNISYASTYGVDPSFYDAVHAEHMLYNEKVLNVATAKGTKYFDLYTYMLNNGADTLIQDDGTHPNELGHEVIAEAFLSIMHY